MRVNDAIAGLVFLAFGVAVVALSWQLPAMPGQPYGAAAFPTLIGIGFVLVSIVLIVNGVAGWRSLPGVSAAEWGRSPAVLLRMALTVGLIILYILVSGLIGFVASCFLVLVILFLAQRVRLLSAVVVAVLATLAIQQAFGVLLRVPLPRNEFLHFLW